ncbi:type II secretion system protein J [Candidatus Omnitrophota bacterium]
MKRSGFSLLEILVVVAIVSIISGIIFGTMNSARIGLGAANNQINSQQEARRVIRRIADELRMTSPLWEISAVEYSMIISNSGNQLDFYSPVFTGNEITSLIAVRYYISDNQLLRREGSTNAVLANGIDISVTATNSIFAFNNVDNTVMDISIPIIKNDTSFTLDSQINLRNRQVQLNEGVEIDSIIEQ